MKIFGVLSEKIKDEDFNEALLLLKRNKNQEIITFTEGNLKISLIQFSHEIHFSKKKKNELNLLLPDQFIEEKYTEISDISSLKTPEEIKDLNAILIKFKEEELSIFADYFGLKTIYYAKIKNEFIFSTEIKAILQYGERKNFSINEESVIEYLFYSFHWGEHTLFNEIKIIEPGIELKTKLRSKKVSLNKYAYYPTTYLEGVDESYIENLYRSFYDNLKNLSDGKHITLFLSGGLDSRIILDSVISSGKKIESIINFGPKNCTDNKLAKPIIKHYQLEDILVQYEISSDIIYENALLHLWITEGYSGHLNSHIRYGLRKANPDLNDQFVVYGGYIGDAILGGSFADKVVINIFDKYSFDKNFLYRALTDEYKEKMEQYSATKRHQNLKKLNKADNEQLSQEILLYNYYCRRAVRMGGSKIVEDEGIMHWPFVGRDFFDASLQIDVNERKNHQIYNKIINRFYKEIERYPSTSLEIKSKVKSDFTNKIHRYKTLLLRALERITRIQFIKRDAYVEPNELIRRDKNYREMIFSIIFDKRTLDRGIFSDIQLRKMYKDHLSRKHNYGGLFVRLFDFEMIMRLLVDFDTEIIELLQAKIDV